MSDRLPPLTSLRAFDAAARHMSFAKAADELHVTPAALSYQIKSLEENLGMPLFRRLNRAVELTEAGRMLAEGVAPSFAGLHAAWRRTLARVTSPLLVVTAGPAFSAKWLAPRLFAFARQYPQIDVRLSATLRLMDFDRDDVDVAIRFGPDRTDPRLYSRVLLDEWVAPMVSPEVAARLRTPEDLRNLTLLHQEDIAEVEPDVSWAAWFRASGLGVAPESGARFSQADHALDAAAEGAGAVLGRISLAARDLDQGRLVAPFDLALTLTSKTRVVCRAGTEARPEIRAFLQWLGSETHIDPAHAVARRFVDASAA